MRKIDKFTIADVAYLHDLRIISESSGETFCECPFCGDKNGKFSYIVKKDNKANMFHCFSCGKGGSSLDLHMQLSGINYDAMENPKKQASKDIFKALESDTKFINFHDEYFKTADEYESVERASDAYCSKVYLAMLKMLSLEEEHKADLIRRGLTEEDIKRFWFRSTPAKDIRVKMCRQLISYGFNLKGVPGFFINDSGLWDFKCSDGYFCPVWDGEFNQLLGFQVRVDDKVLWKASNKASDEYMANVYCEALNLLTLSDKHRKMLSKNYSKEEMEEKRFCTVPSNETADVMCRQLLQKGYNLKNVPGFFAKGKDLIEFRCTKGYFIPVWDETGKLTALKIKPDAKYVWVSSSGKKEGVSSSALISYLPGKDVHTSIVVEGILKSVVVYCLLGKKISVIGVPGTSVIDGLDDYLVRFNPSSAFIFEAYDMDKAILTDDPKESEKTKHIADAAEKLRQKISDYGFMNHALKWDYDKDGYWKENWKGLDDYILDYENKESLADYFEKKAGQCLALKNLFA